MRRIVLLSLLALAGCGADGAPTRPTATAQISVGSEGMDVQSSVGLRRGPFDIRVAL